MSSSWENNDPGCSVILVPFPPPDVLSSQHRHLDDWTWIFADPNPVDIFFISGIYFSSTPYQLFFFCIILKNFDFPHLIFLWCLFPTSSSKYCMIYLFKCSCGWFHFIISLMSYHMHLPKFWPCKKQWRA